MLTLRAGSLYSGDVMEATQEEEYVMQERMLLNGTCECNNCPELSQCIDCRLADDLALAQLREKRGRYVS